jgi:hypothetical protein
MNSLKLLVSAALALVWCSEAWADIPPPPRRQQNERVTHEVSVRRGLGAEARNVQAKIIIPRWLVGADGRGVPEVAPKPGEKPEGTPAAKPREAPKVEAVPEKKASLPKLGTVIAGLAMSLAAVSVVFLIRGKQAGKTVAVVALVAAGALGGWSVAQADVVKPGARGEPIIVIELSDDAEIVTLLLR